MRTIYYAYKDEAGDTLRKVRVVDEPEAKARYYVRGTVTDYARGETWGRPRWRRLLNATARSIYLA